MRRTELLRRSSPTTRKAVEENFVWRPRKRIPDAEVYTGYLIRWLRSAKKQKEYNRVVRLIADIQRFTKIVALDMICEEWDEFRGVNWPKRGYTIREWETLYTRISKELRRHKVFPRLARLFEDGKWGVEWRSNNRKEWMHSSQADLRETPKTATDAVVEVLEAAKEGYIARIRQCRRCGEWFAAGLKTQVYCSRECQRRHYWSSSNWKAHRRAYMRRYRRIKSLPNVK